MSYAQLGDQRVTHGTVEIPYFGALTADVMLASDDEIAADAPLTIGGLTLRATNYRTGRVAGVRTSRVVGGFGGWRTFVEPQSYYNPGGVNMSLVLGDLAMLTGEKIALAEDAQLGPFFVRERAPAQRILRQLTGRNWWIAPDGVTHVGELRAADAIASAFTLEHYDGGPGVARVATESPQDWMPGRTFANPQLGITQTISSVRHMIRDGLVRLEVLVAEPRDRFGEPWEQLTRETDPGRTFGFLYEYTVVATDGATADLQIVALGLPVPEQIPAVPLRLGIPGFTASPSIGDLVAVAFLNGDMTRPVVLGCFSGSPATLVRYNGGGRVPVCYGDNITAPIAGGAVVGALLPNPLGPDALVKSRRRIEVQT